jgi:hypothetical protein
LVRLPKIERQAENCHQKATSTLARITDIIDTHSPRTGRDDPGIRLQSGYPGEIAPRIFKRSITMKKVVLFSVVMAVALIVTAFVPFASAAANSQSALTAAINSPVQAFTDAANGLSLFAPISISAPIFSLTTQNASSAYGCTFVSQTPKDWAKLKPRQSFDMVWTVRNSGSAVWHGSSTKLAYVGGKKMQTNGSEFALGSDVGRGKKTNLTVDMVAPRAKGTYSTLWALFAGNTRFCKVTLTITVR